MIGNDAGELAKCPFCGGDKARPITIQDGRKVACVCGACGKPEFHGRADQPSANARAITAWNTRQALSTTATPASDGVNVHPSLELCIQFSDDGRHIRKWSRLPFDGGEKLYSHPTPDRFGEGYRAGVEADLTWFSSQRHLSLEFYSPVYGDDDDQSYEWRVHKESGSINDREWTIIGRGETPLAALLAARHHDSGVVGSPVQPEGEGQCTCGGYFGGRPDHSPKCAVFAMPPQPERPAGDGERQAALEVRARAMVRQLEVVLHWLNGQAYSSTLSELNALKAALPPQPEGVKPSLVADCVDMGTPQPREDAIAEIVEKRGVMRAEAERCVDASGMYAVQPEGVKRP